MCGRYSFISEKSLFDRIKVNIPQGQWKSNCNIAPMQSIPVIVQESGDLQCKIMQWGLLPAFSKTEKKTLRLMNARAETLSEKPAFRSLIATNRCLIPADGFYEFEKYRNTRRPVRYEVIGSKLFFMGGLFSIWTNPINSLDVHATCTIITTEPNELVCKVHDRMPLILTVESEAHWLDYRIRGYSDLLPLLKPFPNEKMTAHYVHPQMNKATNNSIELIHPYDYHEALNLFD